MKKFFIISGMLFLTALLPLSGAPSPWDLWRAGYTNFEQGESLRERGRYSEAVEYFEKAKKNYLAVRSARPDWNQRVIANRLRDCEKNLAELQRLLNGKKSTPLPGKNISKTAENKKIHTAATTVNQSHSTAGVERVSQEELKESLRLRRENIQLKNALESSRKEIAKQRNLENELTALMRDRKVAGEKYKLLEKRYQLLQEELKRPSNRQNELEKLILQEKINTGYFQKRAADAEQRLQKALETEKFSQLEKNAVEKELGKTQDELRRKEKELVELAEVVEKLKQTNAGEKSSVVPEQQASQVPVIAGEAVNKDLERAYQKEKLRADDLERDLQNLKQSARQLSADLKTASIELKESKERNRTLTDDVKRFAVQNKELEKRLETRISEDFKITNAAKITNAKLEKDLLALQNELAELRGNSDSYKNELLNASRKNKSLESELLSLRNKNADLSVRLDSTAQQLKETENLKTEFEKLQRNFNALAAENRENRLLAEAAKPREAELEKVKLRLLEMNRLQVELTREQQLNSELKTTYQKNQKELKKLRSKAAEFEKFRRNYIALQAENKEIVRLREVEKQLESVKGYAAELAALKIRYNELESSFAKSNAEKNSAAVKIENLQKQLEALKKESVQLEKLRKINEELQALNNNQSSELSRLQKQLDALSEKNSEKLRESFEKEIEEYRKLAGKLGPLNDALQKTQNDLRQSKMDFSRQKNLLNAEIRRQQLQLKLLEKELQDSRKLNSELADFRKNSAASIQAKVDISRITRLEDELAALSKYNSELSAERDRLLAELENREKGINTAVTALNKNVSPEELASAGVIAETDGKIELALWNYKQALANDPDFTPAHLRMGWILYNRGSFKEALPHLSSAFAKNNNDLALAVAVAKTQIKLKRFGNAKMIIEPLLSKNSNNPDIQMCAALIDAGCGKFAEGEERLHSALRLKPDSAEIHLELARMLTDSVTDRRSEAAQAYEKARMLGSHPDPQIEKTLGKLLDHRRELLRFMLEAAGEAELNGDWNAATWYYKKLLADKYEEYVPHLAFAQFKSGNISGALETLEFNPPSRLTMLVRALISEANREDNTMNFVRQSAGAKIPARWTGMRMELEKLKNKWNNSSAMKALLKGIQL